ncbi:MAG: metal ABC transporter permease [Methanomicrobiaceae archaeon]|uniref:Zinc abc transporter, inner membrane permease protein znub n=1 Tax=hydrocarbon metagenome TaxID=938273 RepID=A0A0W8FKH0_9ZZZZ|nr:metal ABC transporter permease [Methanomicrobiaceae archaeon]MDD5420427.1 metal ABC transporter permease [Methanomicrobiaceae archaeon]
MLGFIIQNNIVCNAVEAMLFTSIACAVLGVIITQINISSIGFTMAHAAFAGAAVGMFLGVSATLVAVAFSLAVALLLGPLSDRAKISTDTALGVLFGMSMAVAIFFIAYMQHIGRGFNATALLFGDVISLYRHEVYGLAVISVLAVLFVVLFYKEISAIVFNRKIAEASGIRVTPIYYGMLFIIAIAVALSLNIIGGLLLYVWLVTPAAIAYQFCYSVRSMFVVAPLIAAAISVAGAVAGLEFSLPVAPLTAVALGGVFMAAVILSPKRRITDSKS